MLDERRFPEENSIRPVHRRATMHSGLLERGRLPLLLFADERRLGQSEDHDLFAGGGADVVVQAHDLGARDHHSQERSGDVVRTFREAGHAACR